MGGILYKYDEDEVVKHVFNNQIYNSTKTSFTFDELEYRKRLTNKRYEVKGNRLVNTVPSFNANEYPDDRIPKRLLVRSH